MATTFTTNDAYSSNYLLTIEKSPHFNFQIIEATLPTVSVGAVVQPNTFNDIPFPSEKMTFDPMIVTFAIDEDLKSYLDIFNWMRSMGTGNAGAANRRDLLSDGSLTILSNNSTPLMTFVFVGMFPSVLSEVQFTSVGDNRVLTASVTFYYQDFSVSV